MNQSLKITVECTRMVIPSIPMHFDDVLAAAAVKQFIDSQGDHSVIDYDEIIDSLPLDRVAINDQWCYKASVFRWQMKAKFMMPISQRIDALKIGMLRNDGVLKYGAKDVNLASGPLKSSIDLIPMTGYAVGTAYCNGDKAEIEKLLTLISMIGKKHQRGCGKVLAWMVEECEMNEHWRDRFLPIEFEGYKTNKHAIANNIGIRPPYWNSKVNIGWAV